MVVVNEAVLLTIKQCNKECILKPGGVISIRKRAVIKEESAGICVLAVWIFVQHLVKNSGKIATEELKCAAHGCNAVFTISMRADEETQRAGQIERLSKISVFAGLSSASLFMIARRLVVAHFRTRDMILAKGQIGEKLHVILKGSVEVVTHDEQGTEKVIAKLGEVNCVGEMSLLTGDVVSATVRALEPVATLSLSKTDFDEIMDSNPAIARHLNRVLAERLKTTSRQVLDELEKGVMGRLSMISLPELTQAIATSGRGGSLFLCHKDWKGRISFVNGMCHHAEVEHGASGEEAFMQIASWDVGTWRFEAGDVNDSKTIVSDITGLLLESMRRRDQAKSTEEAVPSPEL
jgi:CRP-like cAMP-binding protein